MKILFLQTNYPSFLNDFYTKHGNWKSLRYKKLLKQWNNEWFGTANFYSKGLKKHGWEGKEIIINDWNSQKIWAKENNLKIERGNFPFLGYLPPIIKNSIKTERWIPKILVKQIEEYQPDVIYSHDVSILSVKTLKIIKKYTKLLVGQKASPLPIDKSPLRIYDLIITSFPHFVEKFQKMGVSSEYLKWCVEKTITDRIGKKKKVYDITYIGGLTPHHSRGNKALEELARNTEVNFWGYGEKSLSPISPIRRNFRGQAWGKRMYEIFAQSKIVVNRHIDIAQDYANNMRMFEATAMGALLITDDKKNMDEFFEVGKEVVTYKSPEDLIKKVKYFLKHSDKRRKIAKAGQKKTLKSHTYDVRMGELDGILRKYLKR